MGRNSYNGFTWNQRERAYNWLKREWASGRRSKQPTPCDVCMQTQGYLMAHSENYSHPYGEHIGRWSLCYWCHMLLHCRGAAPKEFARYVAMLEHGERFVNLARAHWRAIQLYLHANTQPLHEVIEAPVADPFGPLFAEGEAAKRGERIAITPHRRGPAA